jgi:ABC-type antimicrobial peptide transport system permease subunit
MTIRDLTLRNLRYYWRTNLAVMGGIAVATATLAGSTLIGESVRASLQEIATGRLGNAAAAITAVNPFTEQLAQRVGPGTAPVLFFEAVMKHQASNRTATKVLVYGVDARFWKLHNLPNPLANARDIVMSDPLVSEFGANPGDGVLLRIEKPSEVPQESLYGRREQNVRNVRFRFVKSLPDQGIGGFTLQPRQGGVRAAFVPLDTLQKELDLPDRANLILSPVELRSDIQLLGHLRFEDVGLRITKPAGCGCLQLESASGLLRNDQVSRALEAAKTGGLRPDVFLMYLANAIRTPNAAIPYSLVVAREGVPQGTLLLNEWAGRQLEAQLGDTVTMDYFLWRQEGKIESESSVFVVNGVQPIASIGDRYMAPAYPGISDTEDINDWDPPFPMDLNKIRPQDEKYWDDYRATPKAAVNLEEGQKLWQTRFGKVTGIRFHGQEGIPPADLKLVPSTDLTRDGIAILPLREQALQASSGTTDFGEYFGYFSFFLMLSSILLTALFYRLGIEQRLREIGLLRSLGFEPAAVRHLFVREGIAVGALGAVAGTILGIGYSALIVHGLETWWVDAVGTTAIELHISPRPFVATIAQGILIAVIVIVISLRRIRNLSPRQLLAGMRIDTVYAAPRWVRSSALLLLLAGAVLMLAGMTGQISPQAGFFLSGFLFLLGGSFYLRWWLQSPRKEPLRSREDLALATAAQRPGRSFATILLIAIAVFLLVSLESFRHSPGEFDAGKQSGTGGFPLIAESQWPIYQNLNTREGRETLNINEDSVKGMRIVPLRVRPGEDISCLNLYKPARPKIAGVPASFRAEDRFRTAPANAWKLLGEPAESGAIPALVDANTLEYSLHKKVGDTLEIPFGVEPLTLKIVGTLSGSLFQSEILIAEEQFVRVFPEEQGYRLFLIDAPRAQWPSLTGALEETLSDSGFDVQPAAERLAQYHRVENTYLSTFQALGALGLLIGTLGMAAVLLRNVLERRRELALLQAVGYARTDLVYLILFENAALLAAGLILGTLCALVAVSPALVARAQSLPVGSLAALLAAVFLTGTLSALLATRASIRGPLLLSLRSE